MIVERYAFSLSHFRIVYALRPTHLQGIPKIVASSRHAAELRLEVFGVCEEILDGLLIKKAWTILISADSGPKIRSPGTAFRSF